MPEADGDGNRGERSESSRDPAEVRGADDALLRRAGSGEQGAGSQTGADGAGYPLFGKESWDRVAAALGLSELEVAICLGIFRGESEVTMAKRLGVPERTIHEAVAGLYENKNLKVQGHSHVRLIVHVAREHLLMCGRLEAIRGLGGLQDLDHEYPLFPEHAWRGLAERFKLTGKQLQVACAVFRDETKPRIGRRLGMSKHTVDQHVRKLYRKLQLEVHKPVRLVLRLLEEHLARLGL